MIHDVGLQRLPVVFCLDRAGVVGEDGPTHHGIFDLALFRTVPGLVLMQPADEAELADMLFTALSLDGPSIIRYPRGSGPGVPVREEARMIEPGTADVVRDGREIQIWALGDMVPVAAEAADILDRSGLQAGVVNARFVSPLDTDTLRRQAAAAELVVTIENAVVHGGLGTAVEEDICERALPCRVLKFGWPVAYVPHGANDVLLQKHGLTADAIAAAVTELIGKKPGH
jgi:1-deoxy-D-xylulose-5-phosphate synthase